MACDVARVRRKKSRFDVVVAFMAEPVALDVAAEGSPSFVGIVDSAASRLRSCSSMNSTRLQVSSRLLWASSTTDSTMSRMLSG